MNIFNLQKISTPLCKMIFTVTLIGTGLATTVAVAQSNQTGKELFDSKCRACHSIGGGVVVGPDLQGVTQRRDPKWLHDFISAPDKMIASGDPIAIELLNTHNNIRMPNLGLTASQVDELITFLENPQAGSESGGVTGSSLLGDPARGKSLFIGQTGLQNGGMNCIACHNVDHAAVLGGGSLGPDLSQVVQRYGGEAALAGVLASLPFPTMQGVFQTRPLNPQEQADLLAYFVQASQNPTPKPVNSSNIWFWVIAGVGALLLFCILALFWSGQRQSIGQQLRRQG
jgi:cytochrome c2